MVHISKLHSLYALYHEPRQVLQEKNWTEKVTDEMKKFEKSIIKAMRVCSINALELKAGGWLGCT